MVLQQRREHGPPRLFRRPLGAPHRRPSRGKLTAVNGPSAAANHSLRLDADGPRSLFPTSTERT
jgi:hypothetical protein